MPITPVGSKFQYGDKDDAPAAMSDLANVSSISDSGDSYAIMEYAAISSSTSTKLAGRKNPGTVSVDLYFDGETGSFNQVVGTLADGTERAFGIEFSDEATWHGNGIISSTPSIEVGEDVVRCSFTVEKTNAWALSS